MNRQMQCIALAVLAAFAQPVLAQSVSRTDTHTYEDNLGAWVIGQPKASTNVNTGLLVQSNGSATLSGNSLTNSGAMLGNGIGVDVTAGSIVTVDGSPNENGIAGFATGIRSAGTPHPVRNASATSQVGRCLPFVARIRCGCE